MESPASRRDDALPIGRHVRASSDPLSRGGAFLDGSGLLSAEPNPFEQSFRPGAPPVFLTDGTVSSHGGARRARSTSPSSLMPRATPGGVQKLPPLSLMQTPGTELAAFGWGVDSLWTGPLSPALLNGPAGSSSQPFDASFRTGLTPLVAGAAGAGGAAGAAGGVSFPPPSPATAALFAMMTNNTPGTADAAALAGGGPRPHEGPNEGNQFEASFARANSGTVPHVQGIPTPLNSLHRSALANQINGVGGGPGGPPGGGLQTRSSSAAPAPGAPGYFPPPGDAAYPFPATHQPSHAPHPLSNPPQLPYSAAPPPPAGPAAAAPSSLDLLTQASFQNDDALVAAAALSGLATPGGGFPAAAVLAAANAAPPPGAGIMPAATVGGTVPGVVAPNGVMKQPSPTSSPTASGPALGRGKRTASSATSVAGVTTGKRTRKPTAAAQDMDEQNAYGGAEDELATAGKKAPAKRAKRGAAARNNSKMEDEDEMGEGSVGGMEEEEQKPPAKGGRGRKKDTVETEEEKRKNFLERNRQAALKCRQRKKAWLQSLQTKVELLTTDNDQLQSTVNNLKEEVNSLRAILAAHSSCPVALGNVPPAMGPPPPGHPGIPPPGHVQGPPMGHPGHPHEMHMHPGGGRRGSLPGSGMHVGHPGMPPTSVPPGYGPPPGARY
ncbi:hypothetical protein JCM8097_005797 [Rhodosporidiobolus ruineniae]